MIKKYDRRTKKTTVMKIVKMEPMKELNLFLKLHDESSSNNDYTLTDANGEDWSILFKQTKSQRENFISIYKFNIEKEVVSNEQ